jgi:hypothetical protein
MNDPIELAMAIIAKINIENLKLAKNLKEF